MKKKIQYPWKKRIPPIPPIPIPIPVPPKEEPKVNGKITGNAFNLADLMPAQDYHSTWKSVESFAKYIDEVDEGTCWTDSAWRDKGEFYGVSLSSAVDLAYSGWKEGRERVERLRSRIAAEHPRHHVPVKYGIAGAFPNVARAVAGDILNMHVDSNAKSRKRPIITLISNMGANCHVTAETLTNRAAVVAAIVDQIEGAGYACEVISTAFSKGWSQKKFKAATSVVAKASNQPADASRLAFGLGHVSMFRRLVFGDWQSEESCQDGLGENLGSTYDMSSTPEMNAKNIYVLPGAGSLYKSFETEEQASKEGLDHLIQSLAAQGCPAFAHIKKTEEVEVFDDDNF